MDAILLIDFGSTNTKLTAVSLEEVRVLCTAVADTTIEAGVDTGLEQALQMLHKQQGDLHFIKQYACSSAAGGLRMVASGLVPDLTVQAAKLACLGAGAKLVKAYSYRMTAADIAEIETLRPDIFLLTGGTDGGDTACILHNAQMLAACKCEFPILLAGNRVAAAEAMQILQGRELYPCENVMPSLHKTNIPPAQTKIRELFLERIVRAKGLTRASTLLDSILMPTPAAMMQALQLLSAGTREQRGWGELLAVDLGGATTDVYSMASGLPRHENVITKGVEEPFAKRSVEGDIGMRFNAPGILEAAGVERVARAANLSAEQAFAMVQDLAKRPYLLPETEAERALDEALACAALELGMVRHAGSIEEVYTPMGRVFAQTGKDLTNVKSLVLTGGALVHHPDAEQIAAAALTAAHKGGALSPEKAQIFVDRKYILSAMGLLGQYHPEEAFTIMANELSIGKEP